MVKAVDMAWVADKALDIYCASLPAVDGKLKTKTDGRYRSKSVAAAVGKIFASVYDFAMSEYSKRYDRVFVIVPCFPITRMKQAAIITRFICVDDGFLSELGVSSTQFQDFFEKFIMQKSHNDYFTKDASYDNVFILNGRGVLLDDWKDAIFDVYGSSLVDFSKSSPFDSNPNFIKTLGSRPENFTPTTEETRFRLRELLKSLT